MKTMNLDVADRVYLVTGGSRGIGHEVVRALLNEGASVATCARHLDELREAFSDLAPNRLLLCEADVRSAEEMDKVVAETTTHFDRLDGLVVNAGAGVVNHVLESADQPWIEQFEVKVLGALHTIRPAIPRLAESSMGRIVIVNGVSASRPDPTMAAVSAARAALLNLAQALAGELAAVDINVNVVSLGAIATDRQRARHAVLAPDVPFDDWCSAEARRRRIALDRLGDPAEVAAAVLFLLSKGSAYMTGSNVSVDGGHAV